MAGSALALTGPVVVVPATLRARFRLRHPVLVQLARYAVVGGLGTAVNAAIFLVLRNWWDAVPANLVALVLSTAVSTEVNRRFTFAGAAPHRSRALVQNGGTVAFYACYSSTVLLLLGAIVDDPSAVLESVTVASASVLGGIARFLVLRYWVFGVDHPGVDHPGVDHHGPEPVG
jgi:putative flippase GtrA